MAAQDLDGGAQARRASAGLMGVGGDDRRAARADELERRGPRARAVIARERGSVDLQQVAGGDEVLDGARRASAPDGR